MEEAGFKTSLLTAANHCEPRMSLSIKTLFTNEGEIKAFLNKDWVNTCIKERLL